jgi:(2Fe-2S) ferredoxin
MSSLSPFYRYHVFVCLNERRAGHSLGCCASKGASDLFDYLKKRVKELSIPSIRINRAGCLDRCAEGPLIVVYPQGIWYRLKDNDSVDNIIQKHFIEHGISVADQV